MLFNGPDTLGIAEPILPVFSPYVNAGTEFLSSLPAAEPVPAKTTLLARGRNPSFVRLIRRGIVKLATSSADGQEQVLGLRSEGWWAGAPLALLDLPSLYDAVTVTACSVCSIPVDDFLSRLMQNQRALRHFISAQSRELLVEQQHSAMQSASARARLEHLRAEQRSSPWLTVDPFSLFNQSEIAALLSMTPEHLCRLSRGR